MSGNGNSVDDILAGMQSDFLDEVREILQDLDIKLNDRHGSVDAIEPFISDVTRAAIHMQRSIGTPKGELVKTVATRLRDYLGGISAATPKNVEDIQKFVDLLLDVLDGNVEDESDVSAVVRKLPAKTGFLPQDIEVRDVEVMLVMPHGAATRYVEREMQQCGYRTSVVESTLEALHMIIRVKPDFVIVSAMMPELDGIDLVVGLASMPATRNIPSALLTSLDDNDDALKLVPKHVPVIHKSGAFGDDLAEALSNVFLI